MDNNGSEKSSDPNSPNFDAGIATNEAALADKMAQDELADGPDDDDALDDDYDPENGEIPSDIDNDPRPREDRL